ncbi:MAG: hypothetical protein M9919_11015 [Burkholderiaceae bacterium]|jgi:hypothetical protein|nr:hypothetical protein [Burkholderiaceae bacterium]MCO5104523.1 hypothetical protein [Burkholderiaceae bacterium]
MDTVDPPRPLLEGRFEGRNAFAELVRDALAAAAQAGWRELILSDATFFDWPLGERAVIESLNAWARGGRQLGLLAKSYDEVVRRHPRFVAWRATWGHIITCRACPNADALDLPSVIWSPEWVMQRLDPVRSVGVAGTEPGRRVATRELLREWMENKSVPGFASTTLGL